MSEPIIATSWDQLPPNVIGDGVEYSTRILCKQHNDMKARIEELEAANKDCLSVASYVFEGLGCDMGKQTAIEWLRPVRDLYHAKYK